MKAPDNRKAFITGLVVGEEMDRDRKSKRNEPRPAPDGDGSVIGALIGILISAIVIVGAYVVLMR